MYPELLITRDTVIGATLARLATSRIVGIRLSTLGWHGARLQMQVPAPQAERFRKFLTTKIPDRYNFLCVTDTILYRRAATVQQSRSGMEGHSGTMRIETSDAGF
jgi:hypothetical protein